MKNVFITGMNGFVGTALAKTLLARGDCRVVGLILDRNYKTDPELLEKCSVVYGDLRDFDLIKGSLARYEVDTCFHLAAIAVLRVGNQDPINCYETNIMGTINVLEASRLVGVNKVVAASSDKAYGNYKNLPYVETMHCQASSDSYSTSKACMDLICQSYAMTYGLDTSILRCGNIYGPGDLNLSRLIPKTILKCLKGEKPVLYKGVEKYKREFMFISDIVDAYLTVAEKGAAGEAYNVGGSGFQSIADTCEMIMSTMGITGGPEIIESDFIEIKEQYLDSSKIEALGWKCEHLIKEGLEKSVEWYKEMSAKYPHRFIV